jgi:YD repeat-containing protein
MPRIGINAPFRTKRLLGKGSEHLMPRSLWHWDPLGSPTGLNWSTTFGYDPAGNRTSMTGPNGIHHHHWVSPGG